MNANGIKNAKTNRIAFFIKQANINRSLYLNKMIGFDQNHEHSEKIFVALSM